MRKFLSLGAGVQSTALLLMGLDGEIERPDCAIFADTQWEPGPTYLQLDWLIEHAQEHGFDIHIVTKGSIRENTINSINNRTRFAGPPYWVMGDDGRGSPSRRQCTREFKIEPITKKIRELMGLEPGQRAKETVEVWQGISFDERQRVSLSHYKWQMNVYPLVEEAITRAMCIDWLTEKGYPVPMKSSCVGCPYHDDKAWHDMKINRPTEWADAVCVDGLLRKKLPGMERASYMHRSCKPLDEVDLKVNENQTSFLDAPACGFCMT